MTKHVVAVMSVCGQGNNAHVAHALAADAHAAHVLRGATKKTATQFVALRRSPTRPMPTRPTPLRPKPTWPTCCEAQQKKTATQLVAFETEEIALLAEHEIAAGRATQPMPGPRAEFYVI